jgi:hypothetical protein
MKGDNDRDPIGDAFAQWQAPTEVDASAPIPTPGGGQIRTRSEAQAVDIECTDLTGATRWLSHAPVANAASLAIDATSAYAALYRTGATGARLRALDLETGGTRWEVQLQGLGTIHHSKYANRVRARVVDGTVIVYGDESAGRYMEERSAADGHLLRRRLLDAG